MMKQHEIATLFQQIADLLELESSNPFRIRAYRRAAQQLDGLTDDLETLNQQGRLTDIPGIGHDLADKIREYLAHGGLQELDRLRRSVPPSLITLLTVPGIGPKTARLLYDRLKIQSLEDLEAAAKAHRLCALPGFQETKERNLLKGLAIVRRGQARMPLDAALALAHQILESLRTLSDVKRVAYAGSLRRMQETIGDLDLLATTTKPATVMRALTTGAFCARVLASGLTKSSIVTPEGHQVDLRVVRPEYFGAALQYFTGSKEHNVHLRQLAARRGLKINEYGVFQLKTGRRLASREEEDIYRALGMPWIPPELREDRGEIEAALAQTLPRLVEPQDIRGDFHVHTNWSDGHQTLEEVVERAAARGYEYVVITDHSQSLKVAHGLTEVRVRAQRARIRTLNARRSRCRLLHGAEVDILSRGALDYPNRILAQLDVVVGSVHTGWQQPEDIMTTRIINAMDNPYLTILGHPTGRRIGRREPYAVNLPRVFARARATGTALELNASPERLDLNDTAARQAGAQGLMLAISTDSHRLEHLQHMTLGIGLARRAWLTPAHLLNCLSRDALRAWVQRKRRRVVEST